MAKKKRKEKKWKEFLRTIDCPIKNKRLGRK